MDGILKYNYDKVWSKHQEM